MKKVLAVVFVVVIMSVGFNASAQVPFVQVYFDKGASVGAMGCPDNSDPCWTTGCYQMLYVFAVNFNMWMQAIEYQITYPSGLIFLSDQKNAGSLKIGASPSGISFSYPIPGDAYVPFQTQQVFVQWNCSGNPRVCPLPDDQIIVGPHPDSGELAALSYPALTKVLGIGMTSTVCPVTVSAKETTWGAVKSLYK